MSCINSNILAGASGAAGGDKVYVDDVFSTTLYTGTGASQAINTGVDNTDKSLLWIKNRDITSSQQLLDSERGWDYVLSSNSTDQQYPNQSASGLTSVTNSGFTVGASGNYNASSNKFVSWNFKAAPGFFDVVTYSGSNSVQQIPHSLGSEPGMILIKNLTTSIWWAVYHRSLATDKFLRLNETGSVLTSTAIWNQTRPTSTEFTVGVNGQVNGGGSNFVAYIFAHDEPVFGTGGDESIIKCGSYTGNGGVAGPEVDVGFEPQWVMIKNAGATGSWSNWAIFDNMRGVTTGTTATNGNDKMLSANLTTAEDTNPNYADDLINFTSTGFSLNNSGYGVTDDSNTHIYVAIRRPNKPPEVATDVFNAILRTGTGSPATVDVGFPLDLITTFYTTAAGQSKAVFDRIRGPEAFLATNSTNQEYAVSTNGAISFDSTSFKTNSNGYFNNSGSQFVNHVFRRAPGFMDVVAYSGTGVSRDINHNLGVTPELIITKQRNGGNAWIVTSTYFSNPTGNYLHLNSNSAITNINNFFKSPTSTTYGYGTAAPNEGYINNSSSTYISYLFATLPGISKVGGYTGDGGTQVINCGFTNGARFVLIRRTDSSGHWYLWDTARGITNGNDKYFEINGTGAQYTENDNDLAPDSSGFKVRHGGATDININTATYIFLAIA